VVGSASVLFQGTVNNLAEAAFEFVSGDGSLQTAGDGFVLDFGQISLAELNGTLSAELGVRNIALGPAEDLGGDFINFDLGLFDISGFASFADLLAGDILAGLVVSIDTSLLGLGVFFGDLTLDPFSSFFGFDDFDLANLGLAFQIEVVDDSTPVPEPSTALLLLTGVLGLYASRRRRANPTKGR
jgi:hypothetical protein